MSPTVHELRNRIRTRTGRFEREVNAQFTKEELAAIAEAVGCDVGGRRPSKQDMRSAIRQQTGLIAEDETDGSALAKADLTAIAEALGEE